MKSEFPGSKRWLHFRPRLLECFGGYTTDRFVKDLLAGLTVGVVALSLCVGLGIASGATPAAGLYSGIVGGFLISALGGSRVQIGGPAGAFVGLVAVIAQKYGFESLMICTMLAGGMLFLMGMMRLGTLLRFIPQPVVAGFTCGIAITIIVTQIRPLLGLEIAQEPAEFFDRIGALIGAAGSVNVRNVVLAIASLAAIFLWPASWGRRVPGSIVVVVAGTVAVAGLGWPVETIGSRFGGIPHGLPDFHWPEAEWTTLGTLIAPAFTIAMLGGIESLLSAVVADGLIDDRHDSNQELMAQGVANMVTPLFGGIPATGVLARTATNIRSGATSPVAGIVHSLFLLVVLLVAAPLASHIPLVSLGAVLAMVAWRMGDWDEFRRLLRRPKGDATVFLTTFVLTVCFDLTFALKIGLILAAFFFVKKIADTTQVEAVAADSGEGHERLGSLPDGVIVYRIFGALLVGAADKLDTVLRRTGRDTKVVILNMTAVTAMDGTALERLENLHEKLRHHGRHLILCGAHTQPYFVMDRAGFLAAVGEENIVADLATAVTRAEILAQGE